MGEYEKIELIGEGTYGKVFKAKDLIKNEIVAIKDIKLENEDEGVPSTAMREISILKELNHPNIIGIREVIYEPKQKKLQLIFDFIEYDLKKYLKKLKDTNKFPLPDSYNKKIMYQILTGIVECHKKRIIHRDIKPQNILINPNEFNIKIADFGLARAFTIPIRTLTHEIETLWYRAPEVLLGQKEYSLGVDTWAAGCIFAELFFKKPIFRGDSEIDQIFKIFQILGTPKEVDWKGVTGLPDYKKSFPQFRQKDLKSYFQNIKDPYALDLLLKLICLDPSRRISSKEALEHPYFNDV